MSRTVIVQSEINEVMNAKASVKQPFVGLLGTMFVGSDRYAVVIVEVVSGKEVKVINIYDDDWLDNVTSHGENCDYLPVDKLAMYLASKNLFYDNDGKLMVNHDKTYTLRRNGRWMPKGSDLWGTCSIHFGYAENYRDPNL